MPPGCAVPGASWKPSSWRRGGPLPRRCRDDPLRDRFVRRVRRRGQHLSRDPAAALARQEARAGAAGGEAGGGPPVSGRHVLVVGVSHHTARLELRERLALRGDAARELLAELAAGDAISEAMVVSTCNRTELYLACADPVAAELAAIDALAARAGVPATVLSAHCYVWRDGAAARHVFSVASGLDSMILGEAQILGQLRRAGALAADAGTVGLVLDRLLREALGAGRRVRERTAIARASVSVSSAAVELARGALGELAGRRVLVVGAGKSGVLTVM